jgi:hypothetical protein
MPGADHGSVRASGWVRLSHIGKQRASPGTSSSEAELAAHRDEPCDSPGFGRSPVSFTVESGGDSWPDLVEFTRKTRRVWLCGSQPGKA